MTKLKIINGPNLNLLGSREREIYGELTLSEIENYTCSKLKHHTDLRLDWYQSNHEGELVEAIQNSSNYDFLIINPGAFSHTSLALYDALKTLSIPVLEVHLTNIHRRSKGRSRLLTGKAAEAIIGGLGKDTYYIAALTCLDKKDALCTKPQTSEKI